MDIYKLFSQANSLMDMHIALLIYLFIAYLIFYFLIELVYIKSELNINLLFEIRIVKY